MTDEQAGPSQPPLIAPVIILVGPQMGENIGACARAMKNCAVRELRLVNPRDGWPNPAADAISAGADDILKKAKVFSSTREALADLQRVYATTARIRHMTKPVVTPRRAALESAASSGRGELVGILFGPENSGLDNEDVALADALVNVPLNPDFSSLNLAQAVLIMCYEWFQATAETPSRYIQRKRDEQDNPPRRESLDMLFDKLIALLDDRGYFRSPDMRETLVISIRNMIQRMEPTEQDISSLHGFIVGLSRPPISAEETSASDN
ncbi:MAG: RNA methyltransferase [Alphaproteobacteria bacterium]|nr:RNA methyltransferase [Alphaproteobacteria bacterium SS10]